MCDTSIVISNFDVIVDTSADVSPTKGDVPAHTNVDVYNSVIVLANNLYVSPTKGDVSWVSDVVSDVPLTKGDASCVSVADYCMLDALHVSEVPLSCESDYCVLDMDFVPKPSHLATVS